MKFLTATAPPWLRIAVLLVMFGAGYWTRGSIQARHDLHVVKAEVVQANRVDTAVAGKLHDEAKGDAARSTLNFKHDEAARHDPTYREYLDRPLPADALQFLRDAERISYGPDGKDAGADPGRHD